MGEHHRVNQAAEEPPGPRRRSPGRAHFAVGRGSAFAVAFGAALAAGMFLVVLASCRKDETAGAVPAAPAQPTPSAAPQRPVDQVFPGELAEGGEKAFGLPIPRRMAIKARFADAIFATGKIAPERVANYVRDRVVADKIETGPGKTVFIKATLKDGDTKHPIRIEVSLVSGTTQLLVRDEMRAPAKSGLTNEERWKELGLTPKGELLEPNRME